MNSAPVGYDDDDDSGETDSTSTAFFFSSHLLPKETKSCAEEIIMTPEFSRHEGKPSHLEINISRMFGEHAHDICEALVDSNVERRTHGVVQEVGVCSLTQQ